VSSISRSPSLAWPTAPPEQRPHPRDQLADPERLGQVVVRATVESEHFVHFVAPRGKHQDRNIGITRITANRAAQRHAVQAGQHQVEHDELERVAPGQGKRFVAVALRDDRQTLELQVKLDQLSDVRVVLDEEHASCGLRAGRIHVVSESV
jgi:hypothetical protein